MTLRRKAAVAAVAPVAAVAVGVAAVALWGGDGGSSDGDRPRDGAGTTEQAEVSSVATFTEPVPRLTGPDGDVNGSVDPDWHDVALAFPVIDQASGAVKIRLPGRPNGSTAWVPAEAVTVDTVAYRVEVDLSERRLWLYRNGDELISAPVGVGTDTNPTPTGEFFAAFHQQSPGGGYGPFVLVTTAHSETITDWEESGDAVVGVHGPLGSASEIGQTGAAVSHGCIRMHNSDLRALRVVPPGTPISITA